MERASGVLLNISSLPGRFGIGGFSAEAENFVEVIASTGFSVWQTLPLTLIGLGNSPYSGVSSYAGNYLYIDPDRLSHLLTPAEITEAVYHGDIYLTDYEHAKRAKTTLIQAAYGRITKEIEDEVMAFSRKNRWLSDYAVFMCLSKRHNDAPWYEWPDKYKRHSAALVKDFINNNPKETGYYYFEQYIFYSQWNKIKDFAHSYNVKIFGDLPIYVSYNSVDVWANTALFQLDGELRPTKAAGVPPDYFAAEGQLWGNPLYDYPTMKKDGYKWWCDRIQHALSLYDILRIDHFRGLHKYWVVDAKSKTAVNGVWEDGPAMELINAVKKLMPQAQIIAEDLGMIDEGVDEFVKESGFMGMRVFQFGFDGDIKNRHLPYNYRPECVAYTGTHDNDTTLGWLLSLDAEVRNRVFLYTACSDEYGWASGAGCCPATKAIIRSVLGSCAKLAVIPMQDLCGYGSDTRMNIPGQAQDCWTYRTNYTAMSGIDREFLLRMNKLYGRCL